VQNGGNHTADAALAFSRVARGGAPERHPLTLERFRIAYACGVERAHHSDDGRGRMMTVPSL
jgi:hypothetical protein